MCTLNNLKIKYRYTNDKVSAKNNVFERKKRRKEERRAKGLRNFEYYKK